MDFARHACLVNWASLNWLHMWGRRLFIAYRIQSCLNEWPVRQVPCKCLSVLAIPLISIRNILKYFIKKYKEIKVLLFWSTSIASFWHNIVTLEVGGSLLCWRCNKRIVVKIRVTGQAPNFNQCLSTLRYYNFMKVNFCMASLGTTKITVQKIAYYGITSNWNKYFQQLAANWVD